MSALYAGEELEVEAPIGGDPTVEIGRVVGDSRFGPGAVEHVGSVRGNVDVPEQMLVHVGPIASRIERADRIVLIKVVSDDVREG